MKKELKEENKRSVISRKEMTNKISLIIFIILGVVLVMAMKKNAELKLNNTEALPGFELLAESDFKKEETLALGYPTLLDIGGADCIPCKEMAPVLVELNEELMGKAIIKFVDYWKYNHLAEQFSFKVIPTQFFYDENGKLFKTHEGGITKEEILKTFKEMGYDFNE